MSDPTPLHTVLEGKDMIERLLNNVFTSESPSNVLVVSGVSILLVILRDKWVHKVGGECGFIFVESSDFEIYYV